MAQVLQSADSVSGAVGQSLEARIHGAIAEARQACSVSGDYSSECVIAWETVEELQAERSHQQDAADAQPFFSQFCSEHPEADECRIYDV